MKGLMHKQLKIQSESSICVRTVPIAGIGQQNPYEPVCPPVSSQPSSKPPHEHTNAYMIRTRARRARGRRPRQTRANNKFWLRRGEVLYYFVVYLPDSIRQCVCGNLHHGWLVVPVGGGGDFHTQKENIFGDCSKEGGGEREKKRRETNLYSYVRSMILGERRSGERAAT